MLRINWIGYHYDWLREKHTEIKRAETPLSQRFSPVTVNIKQKHHYLSHISIVILTFYFPLLPPFLLLSVLYCGHTADKTQPRRQQQQL